MKHLVIYSHPNPKSFNHAIRETLVDALEKAGHMVRVRDLYAMGFNPILSAKDFQFMEKKMAQGDVEREQQYVRWADVITFIFPVWWNSLPAITRGYIDRVFSVGFAYTEDMKGLLTDKKVLVICTLNAPEEVSRTSGVFDAMTLTIGKSLADFCGMTLVEQKFFSSVASVTQDKRQDMLKEVEALAARLGH